MTKAFLLLPLLWLSNTLGAQTKPSYAFDFGAGKTKKNWLPISPQTIYSDKQTYGFDFGTLPQFVNSGRGKALKQDAVSSNAPFYFSVKLPEGNYKVTAYLGSRTDASNTTVKAESRRLMLQNCATKPGQFKKETFIVNIKDRKINDQESVALKPREYNKLDWDDKLTLEFDGNTILYALTIAPAEDQVTVFLAGNSTVVNQDEEPWASWGQMIPVFFKPGVAIANHAESGLTLGSFLGSRRLNKILSVAKPGDYLFIEFGHNDQKEKGPNDGAYKSYTERLKLFVQKFREKGGYPVILTSTSRRAFDDNGELLFTLGDYPDAARKVAKELEVPLIDLNVYTKKFYKALGVEGSKKAFVHYPANSFPGQTTALADNTHFSPYGAYEISKIVASEIERQQLPLNKFLKNKIFFDPAKPDSLDSWTWLASPRADFLKPDGN
ncbi:rhamnogalacturonan acetylesterase [Pelobium manganitolerans]|uniref:rhamnogalacturonan acetylesterase n=1 Tax=Pelobium manganitolerans TaxID=1842495 RepID=UPI003FA39B36